MRTTCLLSALLVLSLAGCRPPGADCRALDGWRLGGSGAPAIPGCVGADYRAAHELGRNLHVLQAERDALDLQIAAAPAEAGEARRRQRQIDVDIEAIQGLAVIEGWNRNPR